MNVEETQKRIEFLREGPWVVKGRLAWQELSQPSSTDSLRKKRERELTHLLRPHWQSVIYKNEGEIRDSFDEALTIYQLYELAIETGYLAIDDIREKVSKELSKLLWSEGSRQYLRNYCYIGVVYLTQRLQIDLGFQQINCPDVREGTAGRFASFLSQHALWYDDDLLDGWLGFLDDYLVVGDLEETDKELLESFLRTTNRQFEQEGHLWAFIAGADRFITRLAELASTLTKPERSCYGLFYAYWMAKMYGYELGEKGYVRVPEEVDWSAAVLESVRVRHRLSQLEGADSDELRKAVELFEERNTLVRTFWDDTRMLLEDNFLQFR